MSEQIAEFEAWRTKLWELIDKYRLGHNWPLSCRDQIKHHIASFPPARSTPMAGAEPPKQGEAADAEKWRARLWELIDQYRLGHNWPVSCRGMIKHHLEKLPAPPSPSVEPAPAMEVPLQDTHTSGLQGFHVRIDATPHQEPGWVRVPVEPTEEMHVAAVRTIVRCNGNDDFPPRVWRAMLAAAQKGRTP